MALNALLYELIKSLNPREKQFFSLFVKRQKKTRDYLLLFDWINKQASDDPEQASLVMPKQVTGVGNLSRAKRQLYEHLMFSLRVKYDGAFIEIEISNRIFAAHLLRKLGLSKYSAKKYEEAKKLAERYECHYQHCAVIDHQLNLALNGLRKGLLERIQSLHEEKARVLERMHQQEQFARYGHQAMMFYRRDSNIRQQDKASKVEELLEELLKRQHTANTFLAQSSCLEALAILHRLKSEKAASLKCYEKLMLHWDAPEHQHFKDAYNRKHRLHFYNYLNALHTTSNYGEFEQLLEQVKPVRHQFLEDKVEDFQNIEFLRFLKHINTGEFEEAKAHIKRIEGELMQYAERKGRMVEARKITWMYNIAIFYFVTEDFSSSEVWFLRLQYLALGKEQRRDLVYLSYIFLLLIYYENNNWDQLSSLHQRSKKFLERKAAYLDFEKEVFRCIDHLANRPELSRQETLLKLQHSVEEEQSKKQIRNGLEEINLWLRSRLENVTMATLLSNSS